MKIKRQPINWEKYASVGTEDSEQIALFGWSAENVGTWPELKFMFAIPNGMYTPNKRVAGRMRTMGMKRGVSDILLPVRRGAWPGIFIEMKKIKTDTQKAGVLKPEQKEFGDFVQSQGYGFVVCYGFEHARDTIIEYLNFKETGFSMKEHTKPLVRKMTDEDVKQFDTTGWR